MDSGVETTDHTPGLKLLATLKSSVVQFTAGLSLIDMFS